MLYREIRISWYKFVRFKYEVHIVIKIKKKNSFYNIYKMYLHTFMNKENINNIQTNLVKMIRKCSAYYYIGIQKWNGAVRGKI